MSFQPTSELEAEVNELISHYPVKRAASLMGTTVSSFMLQNAYEAARRVVAESDSLTLSQQAFDEFVAACEKPAKPTKALRDLMARR